MFPQFRVVPAGQALAGSPFVTNDPTAIRSGVPRADSQRTTPVDQAYLSSTIYVATDRDHHSETNDTGRSNDCE